MACTVEVVADSTAAHGIRLTSLKLRYWRAIHAEFMTHRVFSRNASSSRAIPVKKMLQQVWNDPAGPIHWGANQAGMQANEELKGWRQSTAKFLWKMAGRTACIFAWGMMKVGLHKQVANRLLEPWQYINVLVTATEWDNFFKLRCHPDAQPEIQELAVAMESALADSRPKFLATGEWHLPYVTDEELRIKKHPMGVLVAVSTARNARTSYLTFDGKQSTVPEDMGLHDKLVGSEPLHASPAEHPATPMTTKKFGRNFRGWTQYRELLESKGSTK